MKKVSVERRNYVIYFRIARNPRLQRLWKAVNGKMGRYNASTETFTPHITIAYDGLTKENFYRALGEFRNLDFRREFKVSELITSTKLEGKRKIATLKLGS